MMPLQFSHILYPTSHIVVIRYTENLYIVLLLVALKEKGKCVSCHRNSFNVEKREKIKRVTITSDIAGKISKESVGVHMQKSTYNLWKRLFVGEQPIKCSPLTQRILEACYLFKK